MRLFFKLLPAAPVVFLLYFFGLTRAGMLGPDEPRYAAIGRAMALTGDWVTPRLWGAAWFEKPALLYWIVAIGNSLGLDADLAPRLPVATVSVGFLLFYFLWIRREFGERAALYASMILATSAGWLAYSHVAVTDVPLAASFSAAMLLALPWVRSGGRRGLLAAGVLLGVAMLAKGLVPLILALPLIWMGRRRIADLAAMFAAAFVTAAPWYVVCYLRNGDEFIDTFFWKHHFGRFLSPELQHVQPVWFYVPVLLGLLFPWTPVLVALRGVDWREPRRFLLLAWFGFGFLFFSLSTNKLPGYILPLIPALTTLAGVQLAQKPIRWVATACASLLLITPVVATVLPEAIADGLSRSTLDRISIAAVLAILAGAAFVGFLDARRRTVAFAGTALLTAACVVGLIVATFPELDRVASARQLPRDGCVDNLHRNLRYGVFYYAGRELPACTAVRERNDGILDRD